MKQTKNHSAYYKGRRIEFDLPSSWRLLAVGEPKEVAVVKDAPNTLMDVLERPIGTGSLRELASHAKNVTIISDDQTRPTPVHMLVPTLLDELNRAGVSDSNISIVVGRGTHRVPTGEEVEKKVGKEALERVLVEVHDPDSSLSFFGASSRGTPIWISKRVAEAGLRIGIGNTAPHYFAGYGGGAKIVVPGVSGRETIVRNHTMIMDPNTVQGKITGNPVYADMLEIAQRIRLDMKVDVLLNMENEITNIIAGEVGKAHVRAIEELNKIYGFEPPKKADVVIASGHPLEENLIQSCKAAMSASLITKEGGTIILMSGCYEGAGHMLDETLQERPEPEEVVRWIADGKAAPSGGPVASRMRKILKTKKVTVVTDGIARERIEAMAMAYSPTLQDAIEEVSKEKGKADVIVLPAGSSINPLI